MQYATEHNSKGGFRFDIKNQPAAGTEIMTTDGDVVIFDGVGIAGMLACTRKSDGSQQLYFPQQLVTPNVEVRGLRGFSRRSARLLGWGSFLEEILWPVGSR